MTDFCRDDDMGYARARTHFRPGTGLTLDETYRLAHLPLVAPDHRDVIARKHGADYKMGVHARVWSLVLPVPSDALEASTAYRALTHELRSSPFAAKIAWDMVARRRGKWHVTLCGGLARGETPPTLDESQRRALLEIGTFEVDLRGLFSGNVNVGRLYLPAFPERRDGGNVIHRVQLACSSRATDLHVAGLWNLVDHLDAAEADALARLIARWRDVPILRLQARDLWLMGARDDLVLDARMAETVTLG